MVSGKQLNWDLEEENIERKREREGEREIEREKTATTKPERF